MSFRIQILPRAVEDAYGAKLWYDDQRQGLGDEFEQALEAAFRTISRFPELYPSVLRDVRRCLLGRFPYGIYYEIVGESVLIVAVFHVSRDPESLADRL